MGKIKDFDVIVIGAGFAGLYAVHKMRQTGRSVRAFEAGGGVGGTWYWNRYPGARCDVESMEYSFGFDVDLEQEWDWTERYSMQPEILSYLEHVADRFDLLRDIQFDTRVVSAHYRDELDDAESGRWLICTSDGEEWTASGSCGVPCGHPPAPGLQRSSLADRKIATKSSTVYI